MPLGLLAAAGVLAGVPAPAIVFQAHADHVLGASLDMCAVAASPGVAQAAFAAARARIDELDAVLSGWRADSELAAVNAGSRRPLSVDLARVLQRAAYWRSVTGGAFDERLGALTGAAGTLDLDGLAKGYVIDAALAAARQAAAGLEGLMIDIGGDVRVWGRSPSADGWRIGLADPDLLHDNAPALAAVRLRSGAVAFSGPGMRSAERVSHILSPVSGRPASPLSVAVVGPTAMDADALATAVCAAGCAEGLRIVDSLDGFEALVIDADGRRHGSRGWIAEQDRAQASLIPVQTAGAAWPAGFQMTVGYEIPRIAERPVYSPYVAIWVSDAAGRAVRTLTLLGDDSRYIDQNFIWWRRVGRATGDIDTIAKPTRRPGRYSVVWDGRDDAGAAAPQGKYVVHIEAIREHGGHAYQSFNVDLRDAAITAASPARPELGPATLRYGPRR